MIWADYFLGGLVSDQDVESYQSGITDQQINKIMCLELKGDFAEKSTWAV